MNRKLSTKQALYIYQDLSLSNRPFSELPGFSELNFRNKGFAGQWLEKLLQSSSKPFSNDKADFIDGDLKTFAVKENGDPKDTISITTVASVIDEILAGKKFEQTQLFQKIQQILLVPVHKDSPYEGDWYFLDAIHINLAEDTFLFSKLKKEYEDLAACIRFGHQFKRTFSSLELRREFLEIRTKDSTPYKPIVVDGFEFSNKGRAFFFKKPCVRYFMKHSSVHEKL